MTYFPTMLKRISAQKLEVFWNDGHRVVIDSQALRDACPCASCKEKRGDTTHSHPLTGKRSLLSLVEHTSVESTSLSAVWPIGRYAIGCRWQDGHDTGIYPYDLLRNLA